MPGVPSSLGCDACRKQKKKCDLAKPVCSRCARLQIPCVGAGKKRFKFAEQRSITSASEARKGGVVALINDAVARPPMGQTMKMSGSLVSLLEVTDPGYNLSCYGPFMKGIPVRLGRNEALDTSVKAITSAYSAFRARQQSRQALSDYGLALTKLRTTLDHPTEAATSETLCAMYLMMVCQAWVGGQEDNFRGHGEGMARMLEATVSRPWQGEFESQMIMTLCVPVILESLINPKIRLGGWFTRLIETQGVPRPLSVEFPTLQVQSLARMPDFLRNPGANIPEMQVTYRQMHVDLPRLRERLSRIFELSATDAARSAPPKIRTFDISSVLMAHGLLLGMACILNGMLQLFWPNDANLREEFTMLSDELLKLAPLSAPFRPLGAASLPLSLTAVWTVSDDPEQLTELAAILTDFSRDFTGAKWTHCAVGARSWYANLKNTVVQESMPSASLDFAAPTAHTTTESTEGQAACSVM